MLDRSGKIIILLSPLIEKQKPVEKDAFHHVPVRNKQRTKR